MERERENLVAPGAPEPLVRIATEFRPVYERAVREDVGIASMSGTCLYASILVELAVNKWSDLVARVRGGDGEGDGGYIDAENKVHGHYWVEAGNSFDDPDSWVVDITADQFGGPAVVVESVRTARPRYVPGSQELVDSHVAEELAAMKEDAKGL